MGSAWFARGFGQELDDLPVFPNGHWNAHEPVLLGGFLHGTLHDSGNFLDALVSGFHGRSRGRGYFEVSIFLTELQNNRISRPGVGRDSSAAFLQENMGGDSQAAVKRADSALCLPQGDEDDAPVVVSF